MRRNRGRGPTAAAGAAKGPSTPSTRRKRTENIRLELEEISIKEDKINNKVLLKRIDVLGRETTKNKFYIEIYNDGTVKKHYKL